MDSIQNVSLMSVTALLKIQKEIQIMLQTQEISPPHHIHRCYAFTIRASICFVKQAG